MKPFVLSGKNGLAMAISRSSWFAGLVLALAMSQPSLAKNGGQLILPTGCADNESNARAFPEMPASLKCVPVPQPYMLNENGEKVSIYPTIIKNKAAAIALGKMLFWDSQVGSDGVACASCHFQAGADNRIKNQINPGMNNNSGEFASDGVTPIGKVFDFMPSTGNDNNFDPLPAAAGKGPNYTLKLADFPLRKYLEPETPIEGQPEQADRNAEIVYDTNDVVSSQGVYQSLYLGLSTPVIPQPVFTSRKSYADYLNPAIPKPPAPVLPRHELCQVKNPTTGPKAPLFNVKGYAVRQAAGRNTPSVINAVYNYRNFWDGRANNVFNGLDPFGLRRFANPDATPTTEIYVKDATTGRLVKQRIAIYNASLASQAVGPALSDMEMSCGGKNFAQLGKKILTLKPLSNQTVDASDSVLGPYAQPGNGLKPIHTYKLWIQRAFNNAYWEASDKQLINGYQLIENNFSLFWGLAVQAYESTLIANDSRFDQAQEDLANGLDKLTEQEQRGLNLFINQGKCVACHLGPELTAASISHVENLENSADIGKYIERMVMGDGGVALYDAGFYNIGVRPTVEDLGAGGRDPYGFPLSFTRNAKLQANPPYDPYDPQAFLDDSNISSLAPDPIKTNSLLFAASFEPVAPDERDAVDGSFKVPGLRNIELTGPYFHNGGQATLEQVIHFYNRGGDRKDLFQKDPDCGGPLLVEGMLVPDPETGMLDDSGYFSPEGGNPSNIAADMAGSRELLDSVCGSDDSQHLTLRLSKSDVDDLVAFLKTLTDERVRWEKAPFDHPSLKIANGHMGNENQVKFDKKTNQAVEQFITLPAIGSAGRKAKGLPPLKSFASQLR